MTPTFIIILRHINVVTNLSFTPAEVPALDILSAVTADPPSLNNTFELSDCPLFLALTVHACNENFC